MLSKKMAVSLTSLITIFALAFAVPSVMAGDFDVKIMGPAVVTYTDAAEAIPVFNLMVEGAQALPTTLTADPGSDADNPVNTITVDAYDENGFSIAKTDGIPTGITSITDLPVSSTTATDPVYPMRTAKKRQLRVVLTADANTSIASFVITIPAFETPDNRVGDDDDMSKEVKHTITIDMAAPASTPKVVSIQRLRPGSQTVVAAFQEAAVSGEFHVRIVLTEKHPGLAAGPNDEKLRKDLMVVEGGEPSGLVIGQPFPWHGGTDTDGDRVAANTIIPNPIEGMYEHGGTADTIYAPLGGVPAGVMGSGNVPLPSGDDDMYHQYRVTITPYARSTEVKISLKGFNDGELPRPYVYAPVDVANKPNGREQLRLDVVQSTDPRAPGFELALPDPEDAKIPADGFYLLVRDKEGSGIDYSEIKDAADQDKVENVAAKQTPVQLKYNVRASTDLPNLETFLVNNGTIELVAYGDRQGVNTTLVAGDIYISEIMWGSDAGIDPAENSQWIELATSGAARDIGDSRLSLHFYQAHETPPTEYVREQNGALGTVIDTVGTKAADTGRGWSIAGKGQSGRTAVESGRDVIAISPRDRLISMYRTMEADGTPSDGTQSASWMQATGPAVNFRLPAEGTLQGYHIGTPGAAEFETPDEAADAAAAAKAAADAAAKAAADAAAKEASTGTYPMQGDGRVYISEIMFAGGGTLPQWIEIANGDRSKEFNLSGWTLTVDNAAADADVDVSSATFTIPDGTKISPSAQHDTPSTILVVTEKGRNSLDTTGAMASGQVINLAMDNEVELITAGVLKGKYALLSDMAFLITLAPPVPKATTPPAGETAAAKATRQAAEKKAATIRKAAIDMAGNLGKDGAAAWALPMNEEGARSSIIRKHVQVTRGPAAPEDGMMMENWTLASDTSFAQVTHIRVQSYYGAANDVGTPGFRAGGALPVELSHFRPARDKATGQVVITWSTQSELNNAGFFVKRAQQRNGEFKVINATMIPGAGTTSEKQFYTYTDTTAQPNVVYYYQIEDVSLDGNRQTLTRGIRLKGHVGAAGKATTLWGELKTSHE